MLKNCRVRPRERRFSIETNPRSLEFVDVFGFVSSFSYRARTSTKWVYFAPLLFCRFSRSFSREKLAGAVLAKASMREPLRPDESRSRFANGGGVPPASIKIQQFRG